MKTPAELSAELSEKEALDSTLERKRFLDHLDDLDDQSLGAAIIDQLNDEEEKQALERKDRFPHRYSRHPYWSFHL